MVLDVNPVILLANDSLPFPSMDLEFRIVGFILRPQQTPLYVIEAPPSVVTLPPLRAEFEVRFVID